MSNSKALFIITGRGLGGDSVIALNLIKAMERKGFTCEVALDASAYGTLFEKNGYSWHKIAVPQAGGHASTKASAFKAGLKLIPAMFKARRLIKKLNADVVIGVLGGGAIVASLGAKISGTPSFSLILTPLDTKVCPKFNQSFILPESNLFKNDTLPKNIEKTFYPLDENAGVGDSDIALSKLREFENFDESKKTIVFSSGSSIFKGTIDALNDFQKSTDEYNLVLVGLPLKEEYNDLIDTDKVIYPGYINWVNDLFKYADLAVLTDDGIMVEEALTCKIPIVAITHVKWGRYHNMAGIFKGAIIESEIEDAVENINLAFKKMDSLKENCNKYAEICSKTSDDLAGKILKELK